MLVAGASDVTFRGSAPIVHRFSATPIYFFENRPQQAGLTGFRPRLNWARMYCVNTRSASRPLVIRDAAQDDLTIRLESDCLHLVLHVSTECEGRGETPELFAGIRNRPASIHLSPLVCSEDAELGQKAQSGRC